MLQKMKLSIIVPCFNCQDTLREAADSIKTQKFLINYEVIFVDDGSTDDTRKIINEIVKSNPNYKSIYHSVNLGGGAARNTAIGIASGDYLFCLDSDDILPAEMLPKMISYLELNDLDGVVVGKSVFFTEKISDVKFTVEYEEKFLSFSDLFSQKPMSIIGNFLYTKSAFQKAGGYPTIHGFDTQGFGFRFLANNLKAKVMEDAIYYHRLPKKDSYYIREVKEGNISKNWFYIFLDNLYKFEENIKDLIINYPYQHPNWNNSEINLINHIKMKKKILNSEMLKITYDDAEKSLKHSQNKYDQLWMANRFLTQNNFGESAKHSMQALEYGMPAWPLMQLQLAPLYLSGYFKYDKNLFSRLDFLTKRKMKLKEKFLVFIYRVIRKIKRELGLNE